MALDRNANNQTRLRRNAQRERNGDGTSDIAVSAPITNSGKIGVQIATAGGIQNSSGLALKLASNPGLSVSALGAAIALADASLQLGASGLSLHLADTSLAVAAGGTSLNLAANSGLQVSSGLLLKLADTSLALAAGGVSANLAASGGLAVSSGLLVNSFQILASDPGAPTAGQSWFNSTSGVNKTNLASSGGVALPGQISGIYWFSANAAAVNNTIAKTNLSPGVAIPAGFFNKLLRTSRITLILGGNLVSGNFTLSLNWGAVAVWSQTYSVNPASMEIELFLQTTATGAAGFLQTPTRSSSFNTALNYNTGGATVDLTGQQTLQWAVQFSIANVSNTLNIAMVIGELLV